MTKATRAGKDHPLKPLVSAVALALATSSAALAEPMFQVPLTTGADMTRYDSNYLELGWGYNSNSSFKFGEFTGLTHSGGFLIGNANVRERYGDGANYLNASAYNFGLPTFQLGAEFGRQGLYWVNAGWDQLQRSQFNDTKFILNGTGGSRLTTPAGFPNVPQNAGVNNPTLAGAFSPFLQGFDVKQDWDVYKAGGGFHLGDWKISADYGQIDRDGTKLIGSLMGVSPGGRSMILPYQINDTQQQVQVKAEWGGKQGQLNLSYWYSKYDNDANSLVWQNPYASGAGAGSLAFAGGSGFPTGFGRMGLMPSNDFWQAQATGAWNFTPSMRLTGTVSYSVMSQNDPFLPYTINTAAQTPGTNLLVPVGLPRTSLNGEIKNTLVDLTFLMRPVSKLSLKLNYHYMDRNNTSPSNQYAYVQGDANNQPTPINNANTSAQIVTNLPTDATENRFKIDADYQIFQRTLLRGWYQYTNVSYSPSNWEFRANTQNNLLGVELRRIMSESFTGALRYVWDQRSGSTFASQNAYYAAYTAGRVASTANINNLPTLRQFIFADYNKNAIIATGTITPIERISIGLNANWYQTQYKGPNCGGSPDQIPPNVPMPSECQGLTNVVGQTYSIDGSWLFAEGWNAFAFYTYTQFSTDQANRAWNAATSTSTARDYNDSIKNSGNTFGLGINFKPADNRYDVGGQYVYTDGTGGYSISGPWAAPGQVSALGAQPIPDVTMSSNYFQLYGKYQYSKSLLFRLNYLYQNLSSSDWAYPGNPFATNSVLLTGHQSPTYHNNVFGFSVAYTNW